MPTSTAPALIAVDVGNSRIKIGRFERVAGLSLPEPVSTLDLPLANSRTGRFDATQLDHWCKVNVSDGVRWYVASVFGRASHGLHMAVSDWAHRSGVRCPVREMTYRDVRLEIRVEEPARVGIDRLMGAVAANRLRQPDRPAIVIDLGTAITVDLVEADGVFAGGAILPGIAMAAQGLNEHTAGLPHVAIERLEAPPVVPGKSTIAAIHAGLYWGAIGAIRELVSQTSAKLGAAPELFLTGGASGQIANLLSANFDSPVRHVPNLVLSGIALAADAAR